ncbi:hypothetical protein FCV25MIE_16493 [Fagus crenata]
MNVFSGQSIDLYMDCRLEQAHLSHKGGQRLHMDFQKDLKTFVVVDPSSSSVAGGSGWLDTPCHQKLGLVPKGCSLHSGWLISYNNHQHKTYELYSLQLMNIFLNID